MLSILPPGSVGLLPEHLRELMHCSKSPIRDFYPNSFNIEMSYMRFFHETIPQLPPIELARIQEAVCWLERTRRKRDFPELGTIEY
jgi:5'-3' exonuclease